MISSGPIAAKSPKIRRVSVSVPTRTTLNRFLAKKPLKQLPLVLSSLLLLGCDQGRVLDLDKDPDPELRRIANQIADQAANHIGVINSSEYSANPVGKYIMSVNENGIVARMDTQTGKLWLLVPATRPDNPTGKSYWKQVVED